MRVVKLFETAISLVAQSSIWVLISSLNDKFKLAELALIVGTEDKALHMIFISIQMIRIKERAPEIFSAELVLRF